MSRTYKDKPYEYRPKHYKITHPTMMRNHFAHPEAGDGLKNEVESARTINNRAWKLHERGAY